MRLYSLRNNKSLVILILMLVSIFIYLILSFQLVFFRFFFPSKVWAHRVITIEKYVEAQEVFSGVELDLIFDSSKVDFEVTYPPIKSIDLSLVEFLKSKKSYDDFGIWLDFKNLNEANYREAAQRLDSIIKTLNIGFQNVIVESKKPIFLHEFSERGFKTSYYLPSNLLKFTAQDLMVQNNLINSSKVDFISTNIKNYSFVKNNFPDSKILTWIIDTPRRIKSVSSLKYAIRCFQRNFSALCNTNVEVALVKFIASSGNR